jgi:creatinine amidohydrolase
MAADGCLLGPEGEAGFGWMAQDLHGSGATGNAHKASAALGVRLVDHFAARLAQLIDEAHDFDLAQLKPVPR